jgi:hypothetical protein
MATAALIAGAAALAAEPDVAALQQEVKALNATVLDLQKRVMQLEGRNAVQVQTVPQAQHLEPGVAEEPAPLAIQAPTATSVPQAAAAQAAAVPAVPAIGAGSGYVSEEARLKGNWSKVAKGMDQAEVTSLLGEPSRKSTLDGRVVWYYYYPATGAGSVFFTDAGRVSSRQSPFGFGW